MTTPDIVERLRKDQYKECDCWRCVVCQDAADEIERLRAKLAALEEAVAVLDDAAKKMLRAASEVNDAYISGAKVSGKLGAKIVNLAMDATMLSAAVEKARGA